MASCRPLRVCKCGQCACDLATLQEQDREADKVHEFLFGLDENYRTVRSNLVSRVPLPPLEEVYNIVRQEEDLGKSGVKTYEENQEISAFVAQTKPQFRRDEKDKALFCKHCNRSGHASETCYGVIGYPEWWGDRPRSRTGAVRGRGGSTGTGRGRGGVSFANAVHIDAPAMAANYVITDKDRDGVNGLNETQWRTLVSLLNGGASTSRGGATEKLSGTSSYSSWIMDTGASHHLTGKYHLLTDVRDIAQPVLVILADGRERISVKEGTVVLGPNLVLKSVFYVEEFQSDLISVGQLMDENRCVVQLSDKFLVVQDRVTKMMIGAGRRESGTFRFCRMEMAASATVQEEKTYELWHKRMGHPSARVVGSLSQVDFSVVSEISNKACDICLRAKQTRSSFPLSSNKTSFSFELLHCDLWGPYKTPSYAGARYFLTVVDDYSRSVWLYLQKDKTETATNLKSLIALASRQFQTQVKRIRSDNGTEFVAMDSYFRSQGIIHETSCVATPQQNGRVERKHRHILNVARALRFQGNLPIEFWGECVLTAAYLINRTPSSILNGSTPYEKLHATAPDYAHLKVFGSLCYAHNLAHKGDKFASRSRKCIFVGYPYGKKAWRLYDLEKCEFFVSRDVKFYEDEFPFVRHTETFSGTNLDEEEEALWASPGLIMEEEIRPIPPLPLKSPVSSPSPLQNQPHDSVATTSSTETESSSPPEIDTNQIPTPSSSTNESDSAASSSSSSHATPSNSLSQPIDPAPVVLTLPENPLRRSTRPRTQPTRLKEYVTNTAHTRLLDPSMGKSLYPIRNYVGCTRFSATHQAFLVAITVADEPRSFKQAMQTKVWKNAMGSEIDALEENGTWTIEDLPPGKRAIGSKWVYKIKHNADGTIERYKARLVALGNKQIEGVDYGETFAPVAKMETVRLFLEVAAGKDWSVHQMDVHNAFLHGDLDEEVYMKPPPGFYTTDDKKVCRLRKSLYGLKQSPRCWFGKLTSALRDYGFVQSLSDYSLFSFDKGGIQINILIYVDDMIIASNNSGALDIFKNYLASCFKMKDLGAVKYFLGIEVSRSSKGFYLSQRKYAMEIVSEAGLLGSKPASFPLEQNHKLALSESPLLRHLEQYRRMIGRLIYLSATRPDLTYCVHVLAQFMQTPREDHWQAALRVVRYIKGTAGQGILLQAKPDFQITGWCDSDWASCPLTRRSVTGYIVQVGASPISWKTRKQDTVSLSSAEAEYRAMAFLTKELLWLKRVLTDLGIKHDQPMRVLCDSKSAIHIATNPVFHERTKHIENDCHFVRDKIQSGIIATTHVPTTSQLADIFTKPLGRQSFDTFRNKLGIRNLHAPV